MIAWLGEFGAGIASAALCLGWLAASVWVALKIQERLPSRWNEETKLGCLTGALLWLGAGLALAPIFAPAIHVLDSYACRSAEDYEMCMDPPE